MWKKTKRKLADLIRSASFTEVGVALDYSANWQTRVDNAPVVGITGGAIDANEFVKGPIYLQGDHSDADYKNMILRPAK